jgi:hypothetical protein
MERSAIMRMSVVAILMACGTALAAAGAAQGADLYAGRHGAAVDVELADPYLHHHYHRGYHFYYDRYSREELTRRPVYAFHPYAECRTTVVKRHGRSKTITHCD